MDVGEYVNFSAGAIHSFTVPNSGYYTLECWGSKGGNLSISTVGNFSGGNGGYAKGTVRLTRGTVLYIGVGKQNYNGGGTGGNYRGDDAWTYGGHGGGATHIATANYGTLPNYSSHQSDVLIVAGGGGAAYVYDAPQEGYGDWGLNGGVGGNQSASGSFGQGAGWSVYSYGASGGGWKGGTGGAGGSSYVSSLLTDTQLTSGQQNGEGLARITLVKKLGIKYGSLEAIPKIGDKDPKAIYYGEQLLG